MKLVPGAMVEVQGPAFYGIVIVHDVRDTNKDLFVPHGTHALVIGVQVLNTWEPMHTTLVTCLWSRGFFTIESPRVRVTLNPVNGAGDEW